MTTKLYWIEGPWPGRLAILPRPRGGEWLEDEVQLWQQSGLDVVLSLLTHEEIAQMIGASRETVTRLFGEFKRKQLVQVKGSTLIIKNKAGLESVLGS